MTNRGCAAPRRRPVVLYACMRAHYGMPQRYTKPAHPYLPRGDAARRATIARPRQHWLRRERASRARRQALRAATSSDAGRVFFGRCSAAARSAMRTSASDSAHLSARRQRSSAQRSYAALPHAALRRCAPQRTSRIAPRRCSGKLRGVRACARACRARGWRAALAWQKEDHRRRPTAPLRPFHG